MSKRWKMQAADCFYAAINVAIGILLGSVFYGLVQLVIDGFWLVAIVSLILSAGLFLLILLSDSLLDRLFSIGVPPARKPQKERRKPLPRTLSLPAGCILGILLSALGLGSVILDALS